MKDPEIRSRWEVFMDKYPQTSEEPVTKKLLAIKKHIPELASSPVTSRSEAQEPPPKKRLVIKKRSPELAAAPEPQQHTPKKPVVIRRRPSHEEILARHRAIARGYRVTNPEVKDRINASFADSIVLDAPGIIAFLDHTDFRTAYSLLDRGILPEKMLIPQYDAACYAEMSKHELFGGCVRLGEFNGILCELLQAPDSKLAAIYADFCGTITSCAKPLLELLDTNKAKIHDGAVIGITVTLRDPAGVEHPGQGACWMEKHLERIFPRHANIFYPEAGAGYMPYGEGAPMATWLIRTKLY
jgi:hypothetical protein